MQIKEFVKMRKLLLKAKVAKVAIKPKLVIIQVNDDFASNKYINGKINDGLEVGVNVELLKFDETISETDLLAVIKKINNDSTVHGLIVQMPLPKHINETKIKHAIDPSKDVDGFHPLSRFVACTPQGIVNYLEFLNIAIKSKNVVIIGRSNIVGKPAAALFIAKDANVTVLHSKTTKEDMNFYLAHADIIVVAVGKQWFLSEQTLKPTAVVIDVGINRDEAGKLNGDTKPGLNVFLQTPVPAGVGLLTRLTLLENLWEAYENGV